MKSLIFLIILALAVADAQWTWLQNTGQFLKQGAQGSRDMWRAYQDMRKSNYKGADKYFHARGNYDAAQRGPGGRWAAKMISNGREYWQDSVSGRGAEDSRADQEANKWGRNGGDPNRYRPKGLPNKY
ncbi:serum amyloid A-5 protein-like [Bombina bombina]|uniref:serum amyloid A-5 protein-like n=1 Tax=Bombina bombina TaxID=8345 RepID=UPI00235B239D|nr:serum amyloid A-5 protein-like [Bombina bombina]